MSMKQDRPSDAPSGATVALTARRRWRSTVDPKDRREALEAQRKFMEQCFGRDRSMGRRRPV
jgi:hypothetical protein